LAVLMCVWVEEGGVSVGSVFFRARQLQVCRYTFVAVAVAGADIKTTTVFSDLLEPHTIQMQGFEILALAARL
jgi:hypothetical protein